MRLEIEKLGVRFIGCDEISIGSSQRIWNKLDLQSTEGTFGLINKYWSTVSAEKQKEITMLNTELSFILMNEDTSDRKVMEEIITLCTKLIDTTQYEDVLLFVKHNINDIVIDESFQNTHGDYDPNSTYTYDEYVELVAMATVIKVMTLVWAQYLSISADRVIGTVHKERYAFSMIEKSHIIHTPPMAKLLAYSTAQCNKVKEPLNSAITHLISSDEVPYYYLSSAVVRRMPSFMHNRGDESEPVPKSLVSSIYKLFSDRGKDFIAGPRDKRPPKDEEDSSVLDNWRLSERISMPTISVRRAYAEDFDLVCNGFVKNGMPESCIVDALDALKILKSHRNYSFAAHHLTILSFITNHVIRTTSLVVLPIESRFNVVAFAYAILRLNGYPAMAELIIAEWSEITERSLSFSQGVTTSNNKKFDPLNKTLQAQLDDVYQMKPFLSGQKLTNPGANFIMETTKFVNTKSWSFDDSKIVSLRVELAKFLINKGKACVN